jgi:hypothetical protein
MNPRVSWRRRHYKQEQCGGGVAPGMPAPTKDAELAFDIVVPCTFTDNITNHHLLQSGASKVYAHITALRLSPYLQYVFKTKRFHCFFQMTVYYIIHFLYICYILNVIVQYRISDKQKMLDKL